MSHCFFCSRPARWFLVFLLLAFTASNTLAAEIKVEAKLIWATDSDASPNKDHKPVDPSTAERLRKAFKWKNYFVVTNLVKVVPSRGSNRFELSRKCTIEITELEGPRVEVRLIGEGKPVHKTIKPLSKGESFIYSGDDKNESAWFIIITELDEK